MGETTARYFRDKLAMRVKAQNADILVPDFVHVLNDARIAQFAAAGARAVGAEAALVGGRDRHPPRQHGRRSSGPAIEQLGDRRSFFVLERYVPGDVYHVDSVVWEREVLYHAAHRYGTPPMTTAHEGGVFTTRSLPRDAAEARPLAALNREVITTFGLVRGVTHTEFIRAHEDGRWYFLETSARVGGAFIVDVVEAASGLNLWREWAHIEIAGEDHGYHLPSVRSDYAGLVLSPRPGARPGPLHVRRPRDRHAHPEAPPRRSHRRVARLASRRRPAGGLRGTLSPRLHGLAARAGEPYGVTS